MSKLAQLRAQRAAAYDDFKALAEKETLTAEEEAEYGPKKRAVTDFDEQIKRALDTQELAASTAQPVAGQEVAKVAATVETDRYVKERSLVVGGVMKMLGRSGGILMVARQEAAELYGENHPVTRALITSSGSAGGFIVPPDYMNEIIELLRPRAQVRGAGPRTIPMPRGTMTLPGQNSPATASYGSETGQIKASQQTLNQIVASFKKLTALVPVSNDMMRYADPAVDAFVRDDLVKVIALREDLAFLMGDGTQDTPRGFLSFANGWASHGGGTLGSWFTTANSVFAVNGTDPANSTGGNFITSTAAYTLATAAAELGGAINRLDTANVPDMKRVWFMHPRSFNYLFNVLNSLGVYVYRDELAKGTLFGYPFKKTTQIGNGFWDTTGTNKDLSFIFLAEMEEAMILDSMQLELAVSREGTYVDAGGNTVSAFQNDQTIIRAIAEHDFQLRHDASIAIIQGVRWAPAIG
jgi:HK97 family phage major capsid protein